MRPSNIVSLPRYRLLSTVTLNDRYARLWKGADLLTLSKPARLRLEWMIWYETQGRNALATCRHFGISPKTFHKWRKRYREDNLRTLEDKPRTPKRKRSREITPLQ
jgi:hypothetical protein